MFISNIFQICCPEPSCFPPTMDKSSHCLSFYYSRLSPLFLYKWMDDTIVVIPVIVSPKDFYSVPVLFETHTFERRLTRLTMSGEEVL